MNNKIRIVKKGANVLTDTNPNNLIFDSDFGTLKYFRSGTASVAYSDNGSIFTTTVSHGLGYIPLFIAYVTEGGSTTFYNLVPDDQHTLAGDEYYNAYADSSNLYFTARKNKGTGVGGMRIFYYKIFKNNLKL